MSLPTPHIQALSTYNREWRASTSRRNISNPYNLAIPPNNKRTSRNSQPPSEYETSIRPSLKNTTSSDTLEVPKRAVIAPSRPVRPYGYNEKASMAVFTGCEHYQRQYEPLPKKSRICGMVEDRLIALMVTFGIAVILAIAIPLGIILPQRLIKPLPINILIPFYMYPAPGAWEPLYDAIVKHIDTNFTIVINPADGPGPAVWPTGEYITVVKALNKYPNVQTLGYIDTAGGTVDNTTVRKEIETYAGWSDISSDLTLTGVFFDHTPYTDDNNTAAYLTNISATVRASDGFGGRGLVVHNPGRVPDISVMASMPNLTVIFEGAYVDMPREKKLNTKLDNLRQNREDLAMLVHSVPQDLGKTGLRKIIDDVRRDVEWLYITDLTEKVLSKYPDLQFVVIINPNSGPGDAPWWPNADYLREIRRLNGIQNVTLVGYVRATYCKRQIGDVFEDIETYASRSTTDGGSGLGMQGIFVDETVNLYSEASKKYLDDIDRKVHMTEGFGGDKLTIHNPGTAVNADLAAPGPDVTVVVETSYAEFVTDDYQEWLRTSSYDRSRSCYMLHSVPVDKVESLTKTLRERAEYLFVTSATVDFYGQWAVGWDTFITAVTDP
ncbi:hypothetical protein T440DRAFT_475158 [Plenodomus tracheiphilus IPT5]|uniref:Uncharacterized protein n=1 Tax=Plenodomus tracheiphilus IPT5 TaxID=1408161 RepID=A0A6A7BLW6_9PLEO|nr:hypothetical protein T440DRAFT_475158 [Plenodomus tracheiphilus IPT5]